MVAALVGAPGHAERQLAAGVDLLIAQGTEAGGHTGTIATMVLTPEVVALAGSRPVLAAGGIASGAQMAAALALGAAGVWCGSVWLSSHEDVANQAIKAKFLAATSADTVRSRARTGKPARQLRSAWFDEWERAGSPDPLPLPLQPMLVSDAWSRIDAAADAGHEGALALQSFFVGEVVGSFRELRPVAEITRQLAADCEQRIADLAKLTQPADPPWRAARDRPPPVGPGRGCRRRPGGVLGGKRLRLGPPHRQVAPSQQVTEAAEQQLVLLQLVQRGAHAGRQRPHLAALELRGGHPGRVMLRRCARLELPGHPVHPGRDQRTQRQVRVRARVAGLELDVVALLLAPVERRGHPQRGFLVVEPPGRGGRRPGARLQPPVGVQLGASARPARGARPPRR